MRKWVLPTLEEELKIQEKRSYTYKDLLDLFDTSVKRFPTRVAMRIERNGRKEQYTFEDVRELTLRAAGFFAENGIKHGDRVILFSNNMPEWGMTYFGILKAGATAIPIDPASSVDEIVKFAKAGEASAIVYQPKARWRESGPEKAELSPTHGCGRRSMLTVVWTFDEVFEMPSEIEEAKRNGLASRQRSFRIRSRR